MAKSGIAKLEDFEEVVAQTEAGTMRWVSVGEAHLARWGRRIVVRNYYKGYTSITVLSPSLKVMGGITEFSGNAQHSRLLERLTEAMRKERIRREG